MTPGGEAEADPSTTATRDPAAHMGTDASRPSPRDGTPADLLFRLVAGLVLAFLVGPLVVAGVAMGVSTDGAVLYGSLLTAVTVVAVAGAVGLASVPDLAVSLGRSRARWVLGLVPLVLVAIAAASLGTGTVVLPSPVALLVVVGWLTVAFLGFVLGTMARTRRVRALLADVPVDAAWRAGWPPRARRAATVVGFGLFGAGVVALVAGIAVDDWLVRGFGQFAIPLAAGLVGLPQPHRFRATPVGIERERPVARSLYPWARLTDFRLTDDALVVGVAGSLRPALRWDRAAIENLDAVVTVLEARLPSADERD